MESAGNQPETPSPAAPPRRLGPAAWAGIALGSVVVIAVLAFFGLRATGVLKRPVPTPACVQPTLTLGAAKYRIQPVARAADGSIPGPGDAADVAYWVEDTVVNYTFALASAPGNLALESALHAGDETIITWADCMSDTFRVESVATGLPDPAALTDQGTGGVTAFVQGASTGDGLVIRARRPLPPTPEAAAAPEEPAGVQADMAFGETSVSEDGKTISISVTITNTGAVPITIGMGDLSLTPEGAADVPPTAVEPALPQEIAPGAGVTLQITFPRPGTKVAVLRILDTTLEQYF